MSAPINPPKQLRIPQKFIQDREVKGYLDQVHQILFQLSLRAPDRSYASTAADYTTSSSEIVICGNSSGITVYLNATPDDGERVTVKRADATVTVDGNGRNIDASASVTLSTIYDPLDCVYSLLTDTWSTLP
jgi:hypothetical protein